MQPGFAGHIVMPAVDEFIEHVRVIASEAQHLLLEARVSLSHQILKALIPQLASMNEGTWHSLARRFDDVLGHRFGIERRQLAVPVDNTASVGGARFLAVYEGTLKRDSSFASMNTLTRCGRSRLSNEPAERQIRRRSQARIDRVLCVHASRR